MAKAFAIISTLICIMALAIFNPSQAHQEFNVEGSVYCDPCRVGFTTKLSENIQDAIVRLECINIENQTVTYLVEGKTDVQGKYSLHVKGDHENDICEVRAIHSPDQNCNQIMDSILDRSRIECTKNDGMDTPIRYANPLAFVAKEPVSACKEALEELGLNADASEITN